MESTTEKDIIEIPSVKEEDISEQKIPEQSPSQQNVNFLYSNIQAAQHIKGFLSMGDCRELIKAKTLLLEIFTPIPSVEGDEQPEIIHAEQEHLDAYSTLLKACSVAQSSGAFHIEGSVMLLERLEFLEKELDKIKSPAMKMKQMIKKNAETRSGKTGKSKK